MCGGVVLQSGQVAHRVLARGIVSEAYTSVNRWRSCTTKAPSARGNAGFRHRVPAPRDWWSKSHHPHEMSRLTRTNFLAER